MTDRESFLKHVAENLEDTSRMLVFSDWLEENGELEEAQGWRWIVKHNKMPKHNAVARACGSCWFLLKGSKRYGLSRKMFLKLRVSPRQLNWWVYPERRSFVWYETTIEGLTALAKVAGEK